MTPGRASLRRCWLVLGLLLVSLPGCMTEAQFVLPPDTELSIHGRPPVMPGPSGEVEMRPFNWSAIGGIRYELIREGRVVGRGTIPARFRVVSIFWPPLALIYWPVGFDPVTHDLRQGRPGVPRSFD